MNKLRYTMFVLTVFLVLALSAMSTVPALADDSTPPPTETPTVETPPTDVVTEEAPPVLEEVLPTEVPAVEQTIPEEIAPVEETVAELLTQVPEGTELVVVNAEGETVPLVTQEAAEIIASSDPQWCPVGVTPGSATCSGVKDSFNGANAGTDLIAWLLANQPNVAGVIWIEAGYVGSAGVEGGPIVLNGTNFVGASGGMDNFALTINGGWTGTGTTLNPNTPSTFNVSLSIINWNGIITLNNLLFTGVTTGSTSNNAALNVETSKNVILNNVNTSNNTGANVKGVHIDNNEGTSISSVTVNTSNLNGNNATGLTVFSDGIITLKDVTASNNNGVTADGIFLDNTAGTAVGIIFTGATIAADNGDEGIEAYSDGTITAANLVANSNGGWGAILDNATAATALGVTISGPSNQFKFNGVSGLDIASNGAITLNSISATNNSGGQGAFLDNDGFVGGLANVTLTGVNNFNENFMGGLVIFSDGIVSVSNVTANDNGLGASSGHGVFIQNDGASAPKTVTLTGINQFINNYFSGLFVLSDGAITISNLSASWNQGTGVYLQNNSNAAVPQNVIVSGYANVSNNFGSGMTISTYGIVSLINVTANFNAGDGLFVDNQTGSSLPRAVTLSGINNFNNNSGDGLNVSSLGAVTLNNVTSTNNANGYGIYVNNSAGPATAGINLNGTSYVDNNGRDGIYFISKGNILLKDLDSTNNGILQSPGQLDGYGAYLDNTAGTGNITVGTNKAGWFNGFSDNFLSGLEIYSNGTVILSNITADRNGLDIGVGTYGYGLYVDNRTAATPKAVTLNGIFNNYNNNYSGGAYIFSDGAITASKVTANENFGLGAFFVNNSNPAVPQNVTLNGYGEFNGNGVRGLEVLTFGIVTLNNIYADSNATEGVFVDNFSSATMAKGVTIKGYVSVYNNAGDGLYIHTLGAITIANLDAFNNDNGVILDNHDGTAPAAVTITGVALTNENAGYGMTITSKGAITINVTDAEVDNNGSFGWYLNNNFSGAVGGVTLTPAAGYSIDFNGNDSFGLLVQTLGAIKITNLDAFDNVGIGAELNNAYAGSVGTVTVTTPAGNNSFSGNGAEGLRVFSNRAITITNLYAESNGGNGVYLDNIASGAALPQAVTLNGSGQFYNNGDSGLVVVTYGAVTLNNLTANYNGTNMGAFGWGVFVDNQGNGTLAFPDATIARPVTLNGTNTFYGNFQDGLRVDSLGAIKANNVTAAINGGNGAYLGNQFGFGLFGVTLTGTNVFESNDAGGLVIFSNGAVSLNNISANWNLAGDGLFINTENTVNGPPNTTLTGTNNFNGNGATGLTILSNGVVTLNNVTANWNGDEGAYINNFIDFPNRWSPFPANTISLLGVNNFNSNGLDGLNFYTYGNVSITKITADDNSGDGVEGYSVEGGITISCGSMTNNTGVGWRLGALTTITLKGVFATGNTAGNTNPTGGTLVTVRTCPLP